MFSVKYVWEILNIKYWLDAFTTGLIRALTCYWMQSISKNKKIEEMITCSASSAEKISPVPFMLYSWPSSGKGFESLKFSREICWFESVFLPGVLGVLTWESKPNLTLVACGPTLSIHSSLCSINPRFLWESSFFNHFSFTLVREDPHSCLWGRPNTGYCPEEVWNRV